MATVGQQLTAPERGWQRYDSIHPLIRRIGDGWVNEYVQGHYGGSMWYSTKLGDSYKFYIKGTKFRIITDRNTNRNANSMSVTIDGVNSGYINTYGKTTPQVLTYEKTGLRYGIHEIVVTNVSNLVDLDAIDTGIEDELVISKDKHLLKIDGQLKTFIAGSNAWKTLEAESEYKELFESDGMYDLLVLDRRLSEQRSIMTTEALTDNESKIFRVPVDLKKYRNVYAARIE